MRTLNQLLERITYRERRQLLLACLGAPAEVLRQEAAVTEDLRQQHTRRRQRVLDTHQVHVAD